MTKGKAGLSGGAAVSFLCLALRIIAKLPTTPAASPTAVIPAADEDWIRCQATVVHTLSQIPDEWASTSDRGQTCVVHPQLRAILSSTHQQYQLCPTPTNDSLAQAREQLGCTIEAWQRTCSCLETYCREPDQALLDEAAERFSVGGDCLGRSAELLKHYIDALEGN